MRITFLIALAAGVLIACTAWLQNAPPRSEPLADQATTASDTDHTGHSAASSSPEDCEAGCSLSSHPVEPLTQIEYLNLVNTYASGDTEARLGAFETLLFHAPSSRRYMAGTETPQLGAVDASILRDELSKTHVRLWLRIVDQDGIVRARLDGAPFPISQKTHLHMTDTRDLPPPELSGTIYRTGLHHLWTRI